MQRLEIIIDDTGSFVLKYEGVEELSFDCVLRFSVTPFKREF